MRQSQSLSVSGGHTGALEPDVWSPDTVLLTAVECGFLWRAGLVPILSEPSISVLTSHASYGAQGCLSTSQHSASGCYYQFTCH